MKYLMRIHDKLMLTVRKVRSSIGRPYRRLQHMSLKRDWPKQTVLQIPVVRLLRSNRGKLQVSIVLRKFSLEQLQFPLSKKFVTRFPVFKNLYLRVSMTFVATVVVLAEVISVVQPYLVVHTYALGAAGSLLSPVNQPMADKLKYDSTKQMFQFDSNTTGPSPNLIKSAGNQVSATTYVDASKGISVTDPINKISLTVTPKFGLWQGKQDGNRIVYPLTGSDGWMVYTMHSIGYKEDVLLTHAGGNTMTLDYTLGLGTSLQARKESDGSIGIYGNTLFSGNIATSTAKDAALLKKARLQAPKNTLLFRIPTPTISQLNNRPSPAKAAYTLQGNDLKVTVTGLKKASYPLTIDPSVYVTTAQQFMAGNNETNIDFDVADGLIEKGQTTGARFDAWNATKSLNTAVWQQGVAVAGGYIYTAGGNYPNGSTTTYSTQGTATYTVPSGYTSITVKVWGAGGGGGGGGTTGTGGAGGGGGFAQSTLTVTPGEVLNVTVGGGGSAGNFSSGGYGNYAGDGGGGGGYSEVARGTTPLVVAAGGGGGGGGGYNTNSGAAGAGGGTSGVAGNNASSGTARGGGGGTQTAGGGGGTGGGNSGTSGGSLTGGKGANGGGGGTGGMGNGGSPGGGSGGIGDNSNYGYAGGGGGGSGYYGGGGGAAPSNYVYGAGGGGGGSSYTTGSSTTNTAGSGQTAGNPNGSVGQGGNSGSTQASGGGGQNGLVTISAGSGSTNTSDVTWAQFDTSSGAIDSANPGSGTCGGWCTTSAYSLPAPRSALSLVAYNGFLYAIGGEDSSCTTTNGTGDGGICSTVYIAKLGANGEPQLWSPVSTDKSTWTYWYQDANLSSPRSMITAVAYNNKMYLLGGKTSSSGVVSVTNVAQVADITATGKLGSWSSDTTLPYNDYGYGAQAYNGYLYLIGGASSVGGAPLSSVYYNKINSDGTLNSWIQTSSLTGGRLTEGGDFTAVWGGYVYLSGGCSAVNANGYCTTTATDTQLASINADGSLDTWTDDPAVADGRVGENVVAWRNYIYEIGGCTAQDSSTGACSTALGTINYGTINQEGDVSLVSTSVASGTSPCSGSSPYNCDLPPAGSSAGQIGQMLNDTVIMNGYLYVAGGCYSTNCRNTSYNVAYTTISGNGTLTEPPNCTTDGNTLYGAWCVDNTNSITVSGRFGSRGVAAAATAVFGNHIYVIGGMDGTGNTDEIFYTNVNSDGSLNPWTAETMDTTAGATSVAYEYAYMRSNPGAASTAPANLFIFGGCTSTSYASCTGYTDAVYKCDVETNGSIANCTTSGQLQIGTVTGATGAGLAAMGGTIYANYIYLIGGIAPGASGLATVRYAEFDNNNDVVPVSGSSWIEDTSQISSARQLSSAFGYNGYIYVIGGYSSTSGVLDDIEFAKINVSDGSIGAFSTSSITINPRWGMGVPVSNSYAYVLGGCSAGSAPTGCTSMDATVQDVEVYNNDSGAPASYTTAAHTYSSSPNRLGAASTILNGYIYVAGGCTSSTDCTATTTDVSYAPIDAEGNVGTWSSTSGALPAGRVWGKLEATGGTLYYIGGDDSTGTSQSTIYYGTPSSGNVSSWGTATNALPQSRANFGAAVWNNRIYVVGGVSGTGGTVSYNTAGSYSFVVPTGYTSVTVQAWGAGGGGGGGGSFASGADGGGGGYVQSTLSVTAGQTLDVHVGGGGGKGNFSTGSRGNYAGDGGGGGGYSDVETTTGTKLLLAAGGGGGGGGGYQTASGAGGGGGGTSGAGGGASSDGTVTGGGGGTATAGGSGGTGGSNGGGGSSLSGGGGADGGSGTIGNMGNGGFDGGAAGGVGDYRNYGYAGGGGGAGGYYGGGGGGAPSNYIYGSGGGGGGSSYATGTSITDTAASGSNPGNYTDGSRAGAGQGGGGGGTATSGSSGTDGIVIITYGTISNGSSVYISPQLNSGGDITSAWTASSSSINASRSGLTAVAYANNLYIFGGNNGGTYYSDSQYAQIDPTTGSVGSWSYSTSLPQPLTQADGFAANGYIYLIGGRSDSSTCSPSTFVAPISANTTVASGNHPTGIGQWYETDQKYTGNRYGNDAEYYNGKAYVLGGACGSTLTYASPVVQQTSLLSQPQVAEYSIMIDTDTDVYPNYWLLNGLDNSIGAEWQLKYQSMTNTTTYCTSPAMTTWGQVTDFGNVTLGTPGVYTPLDGSGNNTNCARFFYFDVTMDDSKAYGYPDDVTRGPTITDLTLQFTADPSKRLMHGRTFTGGLQQPDDTPYYTH